MLFLIQIIRLLTIQVVSMDNHQDLDQQIISSRFIPGITPDLIISEIDSNPLLLQQWKNNSQQHHKRFIEIMMRFPSRSDCPGYIYGFRKKQGYDSKHQRYEIKMGRTKLQIPQNRIFQWQKEDCHQYVQIFTVRSQFNAKLQALVHVLFAYARKTLLINRKKRIQWFQFLRKIPTAAITNLLNLLMQKVHERGFDKIATPINLNNYQILLERLAAHNKFNRSKQKIVIFGLAKTGKTTLSNILFNITMVAGKQNNKWKISQLQQLQQNDNLIEISTISQKLKCNIENQLLQKYFSLWYSMCNSQTILPILIVKQSDIQSSMLTGLFQGLKLIKQYILLEKFIVVINRASYDFNQQTAESYYEQSKHLLSDKQIEELQTIYPVIIRSVHQKGVFPPNIQSKQIHQKIAQYRTQNYVGNVNLWISSQLLKQCRLFIQISYSFLQKIYALKFVKKISQIQNQNEQIQCLFYLKDKLQFLKNEIKPPQQAVFDCVRNINIFLDFSHKENISSFFYVFCEYVANKTLSHSLIFDEIRNEMSAKQSQIITKQNMDLNKVLQNFKQAIEEYIKKGNNLLINFLKDIIKQDALINVRKILNSIIQLNIQKKDNKEMKNQNQEIWLAQQNKQFHELIKSIEKLLQTFNRLDNKSKKELRFESAVGRVKEAVFLGLRSQPKNIEIKNNILDEDKKIKVAFKNQQINQKIQNSDSDKPNILFNNQMSSLIVQMQKRGEGKTLINVTKGQFIMDVNNIRIYHNLAILAKSVKIQNQFKISFKKVDELVNRKEKLKFIVLSQSIENLQNIKIPKTSPFGLVVQLIFIEDILKVINPYKTKQPENIQADFYRQLRTIYISKVK